MAVPPTTTTRVAPAIQRGILAALAWMVADTLGLPNLLGTPVLPLLPVVLLLGFLLGLTRLRWLVDAGAALLLVLTLLVAFTPLLHARVKALIRTDPIPSTGADAIVVLSAAVSRDSLLSPGGVERLVHGVELARAGTAPVLITSRVRYHGSAITATSDADQARLLRFAPDSLRWLVVDSVATTRDEALQVAALAAREGFQRFIVVTSAMHTRRACAAFRRVGLQVTCVAAPSHQIALRELVNPGDRVAAFGPWLYETVGWWWYGAKGWR